MSYYNNFINYEAIFYQIILKVVLDRKPFEPTLLIFSSACPKFLKKEFTELFLLLPIVLQYSNKNSGVQVNLTFALSFFFMKSSFPKFWVILDIAFWESKYLFWFIFKKILTQSKMIRCNRTNSTVLLIQKVVHYFLLHHDTSFMFLLHNSFYS